MDYDKLASSLLLAAALAASIAGYEPVAALLAAGGAGLAGLRIADSALRHHVAPYELVVLAAAALAVPAALGVPGAPVLAEAATLLFSNGRLRAAQNEVTPANTSAFLALIYTAVTGEYATWYVALPLLLSVATAKRLAWFETY